MPRLPGDGAQADSESNFEDATIHTTSTMRMSCRPSAQTLRESFLESERRESE